MPEGDTIFRAARHLRRALLDRPITRFEIRPQRRGGQQIRVPRELPPSRLVGSVPFDVESRGKNLLFHLEGAVLYTHMKMTGSWHVYRHGEAWRKSARGESVRIDNEAFVVVCFNAPVVELMPEARLPRHPLLSALGPDLLAERPRYDEMARRLRARNDIPLGEALMDQRVLAGIGNVYKSELCFLLGLNPFAPVAKLDDDALQSVLLEARRLMTENLGTFRRTTRHAQDGVRHWVYGRSGAPCATCGAEVRLRRQGDMGRSTYFCPRCQSVDGAAALSPPRGRHTGRPPR